MRFLLATAAFCLIAAAPARAQISFVPLVGYDIDYEGPTIGLGAEYALTPGILPFAAAIRPSIEYVFIDDGGFGDAIGTNVDVSLVRFNGDLIGRLAAPGLPIAPYGKVGVGVEFASVSVGDESDSNTEVGLNLGVGAEYSRFLAEFTLGVGDISSSRIAVGYRF